MKKKKKEKKKKHRHGSRRSEKQKLNSSYLKMVKLVIQGQREFQPPNPIVK